VSGGALRHGNQKESLFLDGHPSPPPHTREGEREGAGGWLIPLTHEPVFFAWVRSGR
jgi:hypothetical protein